MANKVAYPELRALLAKYGVTYSDLAEVVGMDYSSVALKMTDKREFKGSEMHKIKDYFFKKGEQGLSLEKIFFDWKFTNEN